jgi:CYTH domain-containing protein
MGIEIERKFLVKKANWNLTDKPEKEFFRQGYLCSDSFKTIRVRQTDTKGFLTIKGISVGATRQEFEYEIPRDEAKQLLDKFSISCLSKFRYKIEFKNKIWEVDEFLEDNSGLIVAEIELSSESEEIEMPDWIDNEVTEDEKYYNANLAVRPFKQW